MIKPRKLIAGNWKMNGLLEEGRALAGELRRRLDGAGAVPFDLAVFPPATLVLPIAELLRGSAIAVGGQDCHPKENGAYTGDVSAAMLADAGATHVILGHSERRQDHGETDALVAAKAAAAHAVGLIAIVCVGETRQQREAGKAGAVVAAQVTGSLPADATAANTIIAYEPVWAIGTGLTATPTDVAEVHGLIRRTLNGLVPDAGAVRILYGGSVKPENAAELLAVPDVDGALVGGASLKAEDFWGIAAFAGPSEHLCGTLADPNPDR
jgi:triosephosphate isomerase (TIM)